MNKVQEAYAKDPSLLGSNLMVGIMEGLLNVPNEIRTSTYVMNNFMLTSDNYVVTPEYFISKYGEFAGNVVDCCSHFGEPELGKMLLAKVQSM
jgi:hypothetical protein